MDTPSPYRHPDRTGHPASDAQAQGPILSELIDDPDMREIIRQFVSEMPERIDALRQAFTANEGQNLRRLAHQLKGAGGGYGFSVLSEAAARVEHHLKCFDDNKLERDLSEVRRDLDELIDLCGRIRTG